MTWKMYRWVWQLRSPLHIGWLPAGALNRTRLYIPARALWGALTAEIARRRSSNFPNYADIGKELQQNTRLSYLFPAEQVDGEWKAWLPRYQEGTGLVWKREDGKATLEERRFRMRLLSTRPGTAIEPASDTAEEGTLREFEIINPYWQDGDWLPKPVAMVGYLFCQNAGLEQELKAIHEILVGGDTRYGLGRLIRVECCAISSFFNVASVDVNAQAPVIRISCTLAHNLPGATDVHGAMEYIAGWDMVQGGLKKGELTWAPGSCWLKEQDCTFREDGLWEAK